MRLKPLRILLLSALALVLSVAGYFTLGALSRDRLEVRPATVHASLSRESCVECHAPIAAEWRKSFHFRSVTGPFWDRIRKKGFADLFRALRVPCMNCHAPANVLDLAAKAHPVERSDAPELGVDCVSCHVSERGIAGPGRSVAAPHEVVVDDRFRDPMLASNTLCARCHAEAAQADVVQEWRQTPFASRGIACPDCHMPKVTAPSVVAGPPRERRSHEFLGDKDANMLRRALDASIRIAGDRTAIVRVTNTGAGHSFPAAGTNWLIVKLQVRDAAGQTVGEAERRFGTKEWIPGYLDFWPFLQVTKIPHGESREVALGLPAGQGTIAAELRYRDWFALTDQDIVFATLTETY